MRPEHGLSSGCTVISVHDGDTITLEVRRQFEIRLRDIDCPELKTPDGPKARDFTTEFMQKGSITVFIPAVDDLKLMDSLSFTRIVGDIWVGDAKLQDALVEAGLARRVGKDHHKTITGD